MKYSQRFLAAISKMSLYQQMSVDHKPIDSCLYTTRLCYQAVYVINVTANNIVQNLVGENLLTNCLATECLSSQYLIDEVLQQESKIVITLY